MTEKELYNMEQKIRFLDQYQGDTRERYLNILEKATLSEKILNKDLYDFSSPEVKDVIISADATSINSIVGYVSVYRNYIRWAIVNGLTKSNINPLDFKDHTFYDSMLDKDKKVYLTDDEIIGIEDNLMQNAQDRVCCRLLYEGLTLNELIDAKKEDVDFERKVIKLPNRERVKEIPLSDRALEIIRKANAETRYSLYIKDPNAPVADRPLKNNGFIVRGLAKKNNVGEDEKVTYMQVRNRFNFVKENYFSLITTKNITKSGMLKVGKDILLQKGKLEQEDINNIAEKFGYSYFTTYAQGEPYRYINTQGVRKVVTEEAIKRVYNI